MTDTAFDHQQITLNNWCRKYGVSFISADARGLLSYVFVDLGDNFVVHDKTGVEFKEVRFSIISFTSKQDFLHLLEQ